MLGENCVFMFLSLILLMSVYVDLFSEQWLCNGAMRGHNQMNVADIAQDGES